MEARQLALEAAPQPDDQEQQPSQEPGNEAGNSQSPIDLFDGVDATGTAQPTFQPATPVFRQLLGRQAIQLGVGIGDGEQGVERPGTTAANAFSPPAWRCTTTRKAAGSP